MKPFIKINVGDRVYNSVTEVVGEVVTITGNHATILSGTTTIEKQSLSNLIPIGDEVVEEESTNLEIKIKYFNSELTKVGKISKGDWIDLRAAKTVTMKSNEFALIPLGVGMKLPEGYEAIVAPRSSSYKNFGIIETNSIGVIDNSYSGNDDQWFFPAYALRDTTINFNDRICQFRIQRSMPELIISEVKNLDKVNRGGHGSTGVE